MLRYLALLLVLSAVGCNALPFVPSWLGDLNIINDLEVSLPSGGDQAGWARRDAEIRVEDKIRQLLNQMSTNAQARLPGGAMEDPMPVPSAVEQEAAGATFKLQNIALTGMRQYQITKVRVDLTTHEFLYEMRFPELTTLGQYVLEYYFAAYEGDFRISMYDVAARGKGLLDVRGNGTVQLDAAHTYTELTYSRIHADLGNPGLVNMVVQTAASVIAPYMFEIIKPSTVHKINNFLAEHASLYVKELDEERVMSGATSGVMDAAVMDARKRIRLAGFDPITLPDISQASSGVEVVLDRGVLTGLSSVRPSSDVAVGVLDGTAKATLALGTGPLVGKYRWTVRGFGLIERSGFVKFGVERLELRARLAQHIGLSGRPRIDDLDVDVGSVSLRAEGAGSLDYALSVGAQRFPSMIKTILSQAVETPLIWIIENQFGSVIQ